MSFTRSRKPLFAVSLKPGTSQQIIENACESLDESTDSIDASATCFAKWLRSHPDIDTQELSRRRLLALYDEFCIFYDLEPLTPGRRDRSFKHAGFTRRRLSRVGRPWVYVLTQNHESILSKKAIRSCSTTPRRGVVS